MKSVVYITKNKIWAGEQAFDWDGVSMDEVFGRIKKDLKIDEIRVVLGNDVSFVTAVSAGATFLTRENVLKMVKSWMPFEIDNDCFDWKEVILAHDEVWIQIVAMEKWLLMSLSAAVKEHGIRVDMITSIGILLGEKTIGREVPVILKWSGKETISVLAINGLVDFVVSEIAEEDLMIYANQKWNLAVNPEELNISTSDFDLMTVIFSEKIKGEDSKILNLPILKGVVLEIKPEIKVVPEGQTPEKVESVKKPSKLWMYLVVLLIVAVVGVVVLYKSGTFNNIFNGQKKSVVEVTPSPSPTALITPSPTVIDRTTLQLEVLNGSGVTGEAARIKTILLGDGFINIDTGNATATTEGTISIKPTVPASVVTDATKSVSNYVLGEPQILTSGDKYDLIIVVGSMKKP